MKKGNTPLKTSANELAETIEHNLTYEELDELDTLILRQGDFPSNGHLRRIAVLLAQIPLCHEYRKNMDRRLLPFPEPFEDAGRGRLLVASIRRKVSESLKKIQLKEYLQQLQHE